MTDVPTAPTRAASGVRDTGAARGSRGDASEAPAASGSTSSALEIPGDGDRLEGAASSAAGNRMRGVLLRRLAPAFMKTLGVELGIGQFLGIRGDRSVGHAALYEHGSVTFSVRTGELREVNVKGQRMPGAVAAAASRSHYGVLQSVSEQASGTRYQFEHGAIETGPGPEEALTRFEHPTSHPIKHLGPLIQQLGFGAFAAYRGSGNEFMFRQTDEGWGGSVFTSVHGGGRIVSATFQRAAREADGQYRTQASLTVPGEVIELAVLRQDLGAFRGAEQQDGRIRYEFSRGFVTWDEVTRRVLMARAEP